MKLMRFIGVTTTAASLTLAMTGVALASDVAIETTGPDSVNEVEINNSTTVTTENTNVVEVNNSNVQYASTGDVSADKNTSVSGALNSGDASNTAGTSTVVTVNNPSVGGIGGNVNTPMGGNGTVQTGGQPVGGQGSVLGASTGGLGGATMLPEVGASIPVDVSALRAAWQPKSDAPTTTMVKQTRGITTVMLAVATILSLLGAIGTAVYSRRKEGGV